MMSGIEAFAAYLKNERRYSVHTSTAYITDVSQFFSFIKSTYQFDNPSQVNAQTVKSWIYHCMKELEMNPRSVNRKLTAVNSFYKFLLRTGEIEKNPLTTISGIKTSKRLYNWVAEKDMDKLLVHDVFTDDFAGKRDRTIIELLYGTGIRRAELIGLKISDIDLKNKVIKVLGKRNKERIIPIPESLYYIIEDYELARNEKGFDSEFLLVTDTGGSLYPMFVQRVVKEHLSLVSDVSKTSPHVLRHTYATHLLNKGADINAIKELLGHASLAATQVYTHNSIERLKTIYKQSHPKS
jgi:integrase/recombinase XerC